MVLLAKPEVVRFPLRILIPHLELELPHQLGNQLVYLGYGDVFTDTSARTSTEVQHVSVHVDGILPVLQPPRRPILIRVRAENGFIEMYYCGVHTYSVTRGYEGAAELETFRRGYSWYGQLNTRMHAQSLLDTSTEER
ncbi:hypothetical protein RRF57_010000 [Xylaria bambusicola]|uniref:Uncharacterized protein n=1 Tax=Xylaria bambusicola TaxID=326684 RepID=A0AAN7UXN4_9PEZI